MRGTSARHYRTRSAVGFGSISRRERYQADVFYADLTGTRRPGRWGRPVPAAEDIAPLYLRESSEADLFFAELTGTARSRPRTVRAWPALSEQSPNVSLSKVA